MSARGVPRAARSSAGRDRGGGRLSRGWNEAGARSGLPARRARMRSRAAFELGRRSRARAPDGCEPGARLVATTETPSENAMSLSTSAGSGSLTATVRHAVTLVERVEAVAATQVTRDEAADLFRRARVARRSSMNRDRALPRWRRPGAPRSRSRARGGS